MFSLWNSKQHSLLGVDIGSSCVRVLELGKKGDTYSVLAYARSTLPDSALDGKNIKAPDVVSTALRNLIKNAKIKTKKAALLVPDSSVITKIIQLESGLNDDEAEELVILEADKYIPYPIDEVSIDFQYSSLNFK